MVVCSYLMRCHTVHQITIILQQVDKSMSGITIEEKLKIFMGTGNKLSAQGTLLMRDGSANYYNKSLWELFEMLYVFLIK